MIAVLCPHCKWKYRTKTEGMGREVVCKHCDHSFTVGQLRPPHAWNQVDLGLATWIGVEISDDDADEQLNVKHCLICGAALKPGAMICTDCGANQITGVVQRRRYEPETQRWSLGTILPLRWVGVLMLMAAIGAGGYWVITKIAHSLITTTNELDDGSLIKQVIDLQESGSDQTGIADRYAGKVTDQNLARFVGRLGAASGATQRAATLLIGCGDFKDLQPLLSAGEQNLDAKGRVGACLDLIGERRLLELSCDKDAAVRSSAARALQYFLHEDKCTPQVVAQLGEARSLADKQLFYNQLGRPWPEATGPFVVEIGQTRSNFQVQVQQYGGTFYFLVDKGEFRNLYLSGAEIQIPLVRWCEATGQAVDPEKLRESLSGMVVLRSPGSGWRGKVSLHALQPIKGPLPGFLPVDPPQAGTSTEAEIRLVRP